MTIQSLVGALGGHDTDSPCTPAELRQLANEMEASLIDHECQFSHPDWRYVAGLNRLADKLEAVRGMIPEKKYTERDVVKRERMAYAHGMVRGSAKEFQYVAEIEEAAAKAYPFPMEEVEDGQ